jgi:hypothetical protein
LDELEDEELGGEDELEPELELELELELDPVPAAGVVVDALVWLVAACEGGVSPGKVGAVGAVALPGDCGLCGLPGDPITGAPALLIITMVPSIVTPAGPMEMNPPSPFKPMPVGLSTILFGPQLSEICTGAITSKFMPA